MKQIALIDGKDVTTDWIEEVFDNFECIKRKKEFLGYLMGNVLYAVCWGNMITWEILDGNEKDFAFDVLKHHLEGLESDEQNIYSEISANLKNHTIIQKFYFKED